METSSQSRSPTPTTPPSSNSPPSPTSPPSFTTLRPVPLFSVFSLSEFLGTPLFPVLAQNESADTDLFPVFSQSESSGTAPFPVISQSVTTDTAASLPESALSTGTASSPQSVLSISATLFSQSVLSTSTDLFPLSVSTSTTLFPQTESTYTDLIPQNESANTTLIPQNESANATLIPQNESTESFVNQKEEWLSDSDSQNTMICSTTSSSPGPSVGSTSTVGGGQIAAGLSKSKVNRSKETPAGQKPAQVVARRNARERRRVQAVNWAFARLRKVVPLEDNKSKRMSKVKTLQLAIEYINQLQGVLSLQNPHNTQNAPELQQPQEHQPQEHQQQQQQQQHHHQLLTTADINLFSDVQYRLDQSELQFRMPPNFYTQLLTDNQN